MTQPRMNPVSPEMEEAVIGGMLISDRARRIALDEIQLTAAMFDSPRLQQVFATITAMQDAGIGIDELSVANRMRAKKQLVDGLTYADVLALGDKCPAVSNIKAYAVDVRDLAIRRSLIKRGEQISALGFEMPCEPVELIPLAGQIIDEMTARVGSSGSAGITTAAAELMPFVESLDDRRLRGAALSGLSSGFTVMDERMGGLRPGELTILAGRPGMGKTALAAGIAESLVFGSGVDVYSVNLEMRERQQIGRLMARMGGVSLKAVRGLPSEADVELAAGQAQRLYESAHRLHMDQASDLTVAQIRNRARGLARNLRKEGRELGLVVVDYLQLITPPTGERNETAALTLISRGLKAMALELGVHVLALSQLNRSVEDRTPPRPRLSDLRGSGSIEQDADTVLFLFRPDYYLKDDTPVELEGKAELIAAKMREGEPGTDELRWDGEFVRFSDWKPEFRVGGAA